MPRVCRNYLPLLPQLIVIAAILGCADAPNAPRALPTHVNAYINYSAPVPTLTSVERVGTSGCLDTLRVTVADNATDETLVSIRTFGGAPFSATQNIGGNVETGERTVDIVLARGYGDDCSGYTTAVATNRWNPTPEIQGSSWTSVQSAEVPITDAVTLTVTKAKKGGRKP